jgi:hypothetical protein
MVGAPIGRPFLKLFPCPEVVGSSPNDFTSFIQCPGDMWQPLLGPHVTNLFATNMPCVGRQFVHTTDQSIRHKHATCRMPICPHDCQPTPTMCRTALPTQLLPRVIWPCHVIIHMDCTDCTVSTFVLPV